MNINKSKITKTAKKVSTIIITTRKKGIKTYDNVYIRKKNGSIEFSDYKDFHILMFVPLVEIENIAIDKTVNTLKSPINKEKIKKSYRRKYITGSRRISYLARRKFLGIK